MLLMERTGLDQKLFNGVECLFMKQMVAHGAAAGHEPGLKHLDKVRTRLIVDDKIRTLVQFGKISRKVDGIGRARVFADRVEYIERKELLVGDAPLNASLYSVHKLLCARNVLLRSLGECSNDWSRIAS